MTVEAWRPIPGWAGYYEVSDQGRVRSLPRVIEHQQGLIRRAGKVLSLVATPDGHMEARLHRDGKRTTVGVHRLVLLTFVGPPPAGTEACHYDDDPTNNTVGNLRWATRSENTHDKVRNGRHPMAQRTHCPAGHPYTTENTYTPPSRAARMCRTCRRERSAA